MTYQQALAVQTTSPVQPLHLQAGPLSMIFEPGTAFLRYLRLGEREIVRGIYATVRDHNWDTIPPRVSALEVKGEARSFELSFEVAHRQDAVDFVWKGRITGNEDGTVSFSFEGEAHSPFRRNRIGICVLHPIEECAGEPCVVQTTDGAVSEGFFPRFISPHQPFKNLQAITHEVQPGVRAEVRFSGEVFEMEDQRNWTDASFKTYCTPLELPFPVPVSPGDRVRQSVTVRLLGDRPAVIAPPADAPVAVTVDFSAARPLPPLGLGVASHHMRLSPTEIERLRALRLAHLRADLKLHERGWQEAFRRAVEEARSIGASLHAAVFLSDNGRHELTAFAELLHQLEVDLSLCLVFHRDEKATADRWVRLAHEILGSEVPLAAGTDAYFAELNRNRPAPPSPAIPVFSINPQVHAFDDMSLIETLAAQPATIEGARQFWPHPVVVSPITLRPRFNPNATTSETPSDPGVLPSEVDPRQPTLFCAGWTLGSLSRLAAIGGVHSLTYYETTGWRGIMETEAGSPLPQLFEAAPGAVFPVYHVFAAIAGFSHILPARSSHPLKAEVLAVTDAEGRQRILVANLTAEEQEIRVETGGREAKLLLLDAAGSASAAPDREAWRTGEGESTMHARFAALRLPPYAIAQLDVRRRHERRRGSSHHPAVFRAGI